MTPAMQQITVKQQSSRTGCLGALLLCASLALATFSQPASAQQPTPRPPQYFPGTGHTVREPFLGYFLDTGAVAQYGYPRTEAYVDPSTRLLVQYFDNARLEWHPGNPAPYKVQLGLLGDDLGKQQPGLPLSQLPAANDPNCEYFAETGHSLCYVFRDYWLQNGGLDRFGYPISEYSIEGGVTFQYFQRARLEWHAKGAGPRIQLAPLGLIYYRAAGFDPSRLDPADNTANLGSGISLRARASVFKPTIVAKDNQTAFVFVTDQFGRPLSDVAVTLVVNFPAGPQVFLLPPTNTGGTSVQVFTLGQLDAGTIVPLDFIFSYPGLEDGVTRSSFLVWY